MISEFLKGLRDMLREQDVELHIGDDRQTAGGLQRQWDYELFPAFSPDLKPEGLSVIATQCGDPFYTYMSVPYVFADTLRETIERDGMFPGDPQMTFEGEARAVADGISGVCVFNGGMVADPKARGSVATRLLTAHLPLVGRLYADARYGAPSWFLVRRQMSEKVDSVGQRYNGEILAATVTWDKPGGLRMLGFTSQEAAKAQARRFLDRPE